MHPARNAVVHVDLQRVLENEKIRMHMPMHFKGEAASPGVKTQGGVVSHRIADVEDRRACRRICPSSSSWICRPCTSTSQAPVGHPAACGRDSLVRLAHGAIAPVVSIHRTARGGTGTDSRSRAQRRPRAPVAAAPARCGRAAGAKKEEGKDAGAASEEGRADAKKEGGKK